MLHTPSESGKAILASEGFMKRLKTETQPQHQSLERTELSRRVMSPMLSRENYLEILYAFYGAFTPLESQVQATLTARYPTLKFVPRGPLVVDDIRQLSGTFNPVEFPAEKSDESKETLTLPEALGVMYVLEGSKLGGKIISRQLEKSMGVLPTLGGSFFAAGAIEDWKNFQSACENYVAQHPDKADTIIESAKATFRWIEACFQKNHS